MAINIRFYRVLDENNKLTKTLGSYIQMNGTLKNETDIVNPEILLEVANNTITSSSDPFTTRNYVYIPSFNRYYFITDMVIVQSNLVRVKCHIDVLMSYNAQIKAMNCIMERQENKYNLFFHDSELSRLQYPLIQTKAFPNELLPTNYQYYLTVAGG